MKKQVPALLKKPGPASAKDKAVISHQMQSLGKPAKKPAVVQPKKGKK